MLPNATDVPFLGQCGVAALHKLNENGADGVFRNRADVKDERRSRESFTKKAPLGRGWGWDAPSRGYILLEIIIALVLLGVLLPFFGQFYQVAQRFFQTVVTDNTSLQSLQYIQFVLREDMKNTTAVTPVDADVILTTALGDILYSLEDGVLKRRFSNQTIRFNPNLDLRCLSITGTASPLYVRLETNYGIVEVQRGL